MTPETPDIWDREPEFLLMGPWHDRGAEYSMNRFVILDPSRFDRFERDRQANETDDMS